MTRRREFSAPTKRQAWTRCEGRCEGTVAGKRCGILLTTGRFDFDHIIPCELGGDNSLGNAAVLCAACHADKTGKHDIPRIAKAKRQHDRHHGIKPRKGRPMPGSRDSKFKRLMNGTTEIRR